tara:strand:+ start:690 stop:1835 length:1146 start_codon:yes stop_codon:yes gene_type:complete
MLKNKIYRYVAGEVFKTFFTVLFAFTAIAWTVRAVSFLDLVVEDGHSMRIYMLFSFFNLSNIITKFIPLSFLLALTMSIIKFERQNELIILWTNGLNKIKIVNLFFGISFLILILQLTLATFITPNALNKSRSLVRLSSLESITSAVKPNDFSDTFRDITIYVGNINDQNIMEDVFIRDDSNKFARITQTENKESSNTTIVAKKGYMLNKKLVLHDGVIQSLDLDKKINNINFDNTELNIDALAANTITDPKLQETPTSFLLSCLNLEKYFPTKQLCPNVSINSQIVEILSRRIGMPLYIPIVSLICSFLLISRKNFKLKFLDKYFYCIIAFIILVLAEVLVRFSGFSELNTLLYFIIPILIMPILYLILIQKFTYEEIRS